MTENNGGGVIFFKADDFINHYGWTKGQFKFYLSQGMPARKVMNQWHGHSVNVDNWFLKFTKVDSSQVAMEEETL